MHFKLKGSIWFRVREEKKNTLKLLLLLCYRKCIKKMFFVSSSVDKNSQKYFSNKNQSF